VRETGFDWPSNDFAPNVGALGIAVATARSVL
jgi:hypothetical protein